MPIAWFVCTYKREAHPIPTRYCAMNDFSREIKADGGLWSETEVLGNYALVKVRASQPTLDTIAGTAGFFRLPVARLTDSLASLTGTQRNAIKARLEAMGYSSAEITASLGTTLTDRTLADVLRFAASRRRKPRYDAIADLIVLDGPVQTCRAVDDVDRGVSEA